MPDLKIEFAVYQSVAEAEKGKVFKFRWMLVPAPEGQQTGVHPPPREIHPTDPRLPDPEAVAKILLIPEGGHLFTIEAKADPREDYVFSMFGLDDPKNPIELKRERHTGKETLAKLYEGYDPTVIQDHALHRFNELTALTTLDGAAAPLTEDFIYQFCRISARHYRGDRTDLHLRQRASLDLCADDLQNSFVGQVGALLEAQLGAASLTDTGEPLMTAEDVSRLALVAPLVGDAIRPQQDGLGSVVVAIASGQQVDVYAGQGDPDHPELDVPIDRVDIGELLGLQRRIKISELPPEFLDDTGALRKTTARVQYRMPDGSLMLSGRIEDCFGAGSLVQGGGGDFPQPTATFIEDAYFDHLLEQIGTEPPHPCEPEFTFKSAVGDGLVAFSVTGIAEPTAQFTAFTMIRREDAAAPSAAEIAEAIKQAPVTPQHLDTLPMDVRPPTSPFGGGTRALALSAFHEFLFVDPTGTQPTEIARPVTPEQFHKDKTTAADLARNRLPAFGRIFYYWLVVKGLGGDWLVESPFRVQRGTSSPLAVPPGVLQTAEEQQFGFPVLSATQADGPRSSSKPEGDQAVGTPGGLVLGGVPVGDPGRYPCQILVFNENIDAARPEGTDMPSYIDAFHIREFHVLLFRRVPKVKLDAPPADLEGFFDLVEPEDLEYYRSRQWFRDLEKQGWTFYAHAAAPAAGPIGPKREVLRDLHHADGTPLLLDSGWEYQPVVIGKRDPKSCYQVTASPFPTRRLNIRRDPVNPNASPVVLPENGTEPVRYLTEEGLAPTTSKPLLRLEYSDPAICPVKYAAATKRPPEPSFIGGSAPALGLEPIGLRPYRTLPLRQEDGVRETDLIAILSQAPTARNAAPLEEFKKTYLQGLLDRTVPTDAPTGPGIGGTPVGQKFDAWLQTQLFPTDLPPDTTRQALAASTVGVRGVVFGSDPNGSRGIMPNADGIPVVGVRWARTSRHQYAEFAPTIEWKNEGAVLKTGERPPGLSTGVAAPGQPVFKTNTPVMLALQLPPSTDGTALTFEHFYEGAIANSLRAGSETVDHLLPSGNFPVENEHTAFGSLHAAARYILSGSLLILNPPLEIEIATDDPTTYLVAIELQSHGQWLRYFADLARATTRLQALSLKIPATTGTPPASGFARIALVREIPRFSAAYGQTKDDGTPLPAQDFFDVVESDQEDTLVYTARLLAPGPQRVGPDDFIPPLVGPASGLAFPFLSSVVPPTPQIFSVRPEPWNLRYQWATIQKMPDGRKIFIYDATNSFQFELDFRFVGDVTALHAARPLPVILAELRTGNWDCWSGSDGIAVKSYLQSRAVRTEIDEHDTETSVVALLHGRDILSGQALLASGNVRSLLPIQDDPRRRESWQSRYRLRALENFAQSPDRLSVLCSDWTPWSDWLTTLPPKPQFLSASVTIAPLVPPPSPPRNQITVTFQAHNRKAIEFTDQKPQTLPIFYRVVIRRKASAIGAGPFLPGREIAVTEVVLDHATPTVDFPTLTFGPYIDGSVAPPSRVPRTFRYSYELEIHLCKRRLRPTPAIIVVSKSDAFPLSLAPESSATVRSEERDFSNGQFAFLDESTPREFWDSLNAMGWERVPGKNIAVLKQREQAGRLPFKAGVCGGKGNEGILRIESSETPFSVFLLEGGELDIAAAVIKRTGNTNPILSFA